MKEIKSLILWLQNHSFFKEAQQLEEVSEEPKEWSEPWHEEAVKEFDQPFETLDEMENKQENLIEVIFPQILHKEGFKVISAGTEYLGGGMHGQVYDGIYQGHQAAAKLIIHDSNNLEKMTATPEVTNWKFILNNINKLPANLKNHIPQIYHLNADCLNEICYEIIIMEKLYPLSKQIQSIIQGFGQEHERVMKDYLNNDNFLYYLADKIKKSLDSLTDFPQNIINASKLQEYLSHMDLSFAATNYKSLTPVIVKYFMSLEPMLNWIQQDPQSNQHYLSWGVNRAIHQIFTESFPRNYTPNIPLPARTPELKGLYKTLISLHNLGLDWNDTHYQNIMQDKDGNIKLIDVGNFNLTQDF